MKQISLNRVAGISVALTLILFFFSLDLLTKKYMREIGVGVCNEGISFGFGWISEPMIIAVSILLIIAGSIYLFAFKIGSFVKIDLLWVGLVLMIAGGLANLVSRLQWGCVWDWISLGIGDLNFNVADVVIDVGFVLFTLGVGMIMYKNRNSG